jgi:signal transduction histidine kinase
VRRRLLLSHLAVAAVAVLLLGVPALVFTLRRPAAIVVFVAAILLAGWLAIALARWLARPVAELAEAAARLGAGDPRPLGRRYGVSDLDQMADGLDSSARRLSSLLAADRELAVDVSHQLRTPLTALSMRLEEMIASADEPDVVREEGHAALVQAERLADTVSQLLSPARRAPSAALTGVDEVIRQQVVEWEPAFRRAKRRLVVIGVRELQAHFTPGGLAQVIATLLDNALMHGGGTVTIQTSQSMRSVVIEVRDEGRGVPAELVSRIFERSVSGRPEGTGLGLALARTMAAADGGRVVLVKARPATFAVFLPRNPPATAPAPVRGPALSSAALSEGDGLGGCGFLRRERRLRSQEYPLLVREVTEDRAESGAEHAGRVVGQVSLQAGPVAGCRDDRLGDTQSDHIQQHEHEGFAADRLACPVPEGPEPAAEIGDHSSH